MKPLTLPVLGLSLLLLGSGCHQAASHSREMQQQFYASVKNVNPEEDKALRRAQYYKLAGRFDLALKELDAAIASDPHNIRLLNAMGNCCDRLGDYSRAQEIYANILAQDPENSIVKNNLGYSRYLAGDLARAEKIFQEVLALNPKDPVVGNNLGLVWCRQGKEAQALKLWQANDGDIQAREKLNQVLAFLNKTPEKSAVATCLEPDRPLRGSAVRQENPENDNKPPEVAHNPKKPVSRRTSDLVAANPKPAPAENSNIAGAMHPAPQAPPVSVEEVKMIIQPASYSPPPEVVNSGAQDASPYLYGVNRPGRKEVVSSQANFSQLEVNNPGSRKYYRSCNRPRQWQRTWKPRMVTYTPPEPHRTTKPIKHAITRESLYQSQNASDRHKTVIY